MHHRDLDEPLELDTADLEGLLAGIRGATPTGSALIRGRLREFQKRSFPMKANAGRGRRAVYGIRQALHLAFAFELVDLEISSSRCINIVEQNRRSIDALCLAAFATHRAARGGMDDAEVDAMRVRLAMHVALSAATHELGAASAFGVTAGPDAPPGWPGRRARITIDTVALVADVIDALEGRAFRCLPEEVDHAFAAMGREAFGSEDEAAWRRAAPRPHDDRVAR